VLAVLAPIFRRLWALQADSKRIYFAPVPWGVVVAAPEVGLVHVPLGDVAVPRATEPDFLRRPSRWGPENELPSGDRNMRPADVSDQLFGGVHSGAFLGARERRGASVGVR